MINTFLAQAKAGNELSVQGYVDSYRDLDIKVSFGKGNIARIPWISFPGERAIRLKGIYPVFLLFQRGERSAPVLRGKQEIDRNLGVTSARRPQCETGSGTGLAVTRIATARPTCVRPVN